MNTLKLGIWEECPMCEFEGTLIVDECRFHECDHYHVVECWYCKGTGAQFKSWYSHVYWWISRQLWKRYPEAKKRELRRLREEMRHKALKRESEMLNDVFSKAWASGSNHS